jgi:O-antigen ligase
VSFVFVLALWLTFSRGAWLAVGIGVVVGGLLLEWRIILMFAALVLAVALLVPVLPGAETSAAVPAASASPAPSAPATSAAPTPRPTPRPAIRLGGKHRLNSEESRLYFVANGFEVIRDHPIVGVGPGRYGGAVAAIVGSPVHERYGTEFGNLRTVHNFWLHLTAEVGVAGTAVFAGMIAAFVIRFARAARSADGATFVVLAGSVTALVVITVNNGFEMLFEGNIPAVLIWLIIAIASVMAPDPRLGLLSGTGPRRA